LTWWSIIESFIATVAHVGQVGVGVSTGCACTRVTERATGALRHARDEDTNAIFQLVAFDTLSTASSNVGIFVAAYCAIVSRIGTSMALRLASLTWWSIVITI